MKDEMIYMNEFIIGLAQGEREYKINGVKYIVSSRFQERNFEDEESNTTIRKRLKKVIGSDFTDLTTTKTNITIKDNQVNMLAGKED